MNQLFRLISIMLLMCMIVGVFVSCDDFDSSLKEPEQTQETTTTHKKESETEKDPEQTQETSTTDEKESETEAETEKKVLLAEIDEISLDRSKGRCIFRRDYDGGLTGEAVFGVSRFLYSTKNIAVYKEIKRPSSGGTCVEIREGDELTNLIVVFQKDHKLTDKEKDILEEFGIGYMFEK